MDDESDGSEVISDYEEENLEGSEIDEGIFKKN